MMEEEKMAEKTIVSDANMNEKEAPRISGMAVLVLNTLLMAAALALAVWGMADGEPTGGDAVLVTITMIYVCIIGPLFYAGLKILKPREALVLTLFGKYHGTLTGPGFFCVNPFAAAVNPASGAATSGRTGSEAAAETAAASGKRGRGKLVSLKVLTLNNDRQKINDQLGNPIIIGIAVIWKVVNTAKAVFNVDNYPEYLSIQCDAALRSIVRLYPYDNAGNDADNEKSLRSSSEEVSEKLKAEIQSKVAIAGLEILEARITHLSYAPEIAAVMLQRQQASAVIDAKAMIVEGAVGMVEMALAKLSDKNIVQLDEERKAAMVSNLLVVLCSSKDTQPVVNSGSIY
jgi:regulator of protease activity HflC (stomatin/prohibitin superfamily)